MFARVVRAALFCATLLVAWTIARPAHAAAWAPFCDDRGATALAAPPALEAPDEAVRRVRVTGCGHRLDVDVLMASLGPSRGHASAGSDAPGPACLNPATVTAAPVALALVEVLPPRRPAIGARGRVERPPRG